MSEVRIHQGLQSHPAPMVQCQNILTPSGLNWSEINMLVVNVLWFQYPLTNWLLVWGWESVYGVLRQCANILHLFSSMLVACPIHKIWSWYSEQIWLYEPSKTDLYEIWGHTKSSPESNIRTRLNVENMMCYKARTYFVPMYLYKLIQWTIGYKNMLQLKVVSHLANHVLLNNFEKPNQVESPETRSSCSTSQVWCQTVLCSVAINQS